jgi:hypothetical protein
LGSNVEAKVVSAVQQLAVFALCTQSWTPQNVIRVVVANDGIEELREIMLEDSLKPIKVYEFVREEAEVLQSIMHAMGSQQSDGTFIVADMNSMIFEFDCILAEVKL